MNKDLELLLKSDIFVGRQCIVLEDINHKIIWKPFEIDSVVQESPFPFRYYPHIGETFVLAHSLKYKVLETNAIINADSMVRIYTLESMETVSEPLENVELAKCDICGKEVGDLKRVHHRFVSTSNDLKDISIQYLEVNECRKCIDSGDDKVIRIRNLGTSIELTLDEWSYIEQSHKDNIDYVMMDMNKFEQLLNCMCNQKFIHERKDGTVAKDQEIIDKAYHEARSLMTIPRVANKPCKTPESEKLNTLTLKECKPHHTLTLRNLIDYGVFNREVIKYIKISNSDNTELTNFDIIDGKYVHTVGNSIAKDEINMLEKFGDRVINDIISICDRTAVISVFDEVNECKYTTKTTLKDLKAIYKTTLRSLMNSKTINSKFIRIQFGGSDVVAEYELIDGSYVIGARRYNMLDDLGDRIVTRTDRWSNTLVTIDLLEEDGVSKEGD